MWLAVLIYALLYTEALYSIFKQIKIYTTRVQGLYYFRRNKVIYISLFMFTIIFTIAFPTFLIYDYINFQKEFNISNNGQLLVSIFYFLWGIRVIIQQIHKDMISDKGIHIYGKLNKWITIDRYRWYELDSINVNSNKYRGLYIYIYRTKLGKLISGDDFKELNFKIPNGDINDVNNILEKYIIKKYDA